MIVVTGATGFVGRSLTRALVEQGETVRAVVRPTSDRAQLAGCDVQFVTADVTQPHTLKGIFDGATAVIHAAGMLGTTGVPESAYHTLHVTGTRNVLDEIATVNGDSRPRILYVSSPGVLGVIGDDPPADETRPRNPSNPYERSKAAAERLVETYIENRNMDIVIGRPEFIYGGDDTHVLGLFQAIEAGRFIYFDDGCHSCHPTHIDDAVNGLLLALERGKSGEIYHITGRDPVTFRRLGEMIAAEFGVRPPFISLPRSIGMMGAFIMERILPNPPLSQDGVAFFSESRRFSWQKAHDQLGYTPQVSLGNGIKHTIAQKDTTPDVSSITAVHP